MDKLLIILSAIFCLIAIGVGSLTEDSWRSTAITYGFLAIGIVLFGVALTIK